MSESVRKVNLIDSNSLSDNQKAYNQPGNARVGIGVNNTESVQSFARNIAQNDLFRSSGFLSRPRIIAIVISCSLASNVLFEFTVSATAIQRKANHVMKNT